MFPMGVLSVTRTAPSARAWSVAAHRSADPTPALLSLATTEDGQAWAGSAQARLVRRTNTTTPGWVRMSGSIGVTSSMIAIWASARSIRAIGDDGAVVEGRLA